MRDNQTDTIGSAGAEVDRVRGGLRKVEYTSCVDNQVGLTDLQSQCRFDKRTHKAHSGSPQVVHEFT